MSQYTAPHRATSKRSLSRRTRLVLLTSLLVPASLLAIAKSPVHANPNSNPIFATLQDVQDAINTALTPVNNAIASLQQQQTTQSQQISSLQNAGSKALHVYDANGQDLGLATDHSGNQTTVYSPTLQRFIYLNINNISSINGNLTSNAVVYFQSNNCTGTPYSIVEGNTPYDIPYTLPDATVANITPNDLLQVSPQHFYVIPDGATPTFMAPSSEQYWISGTITTGCFTGPFNFQPEPHAYALQQVSLPFTLPLALPLQFKYQ